MKTGKIKRRITALLLSFTMTAGINTVTVEPQAGNLEGEENLSSVEDEKLYVEENREEAIILLDQDGGEIYSTMEEPLNVTYGESVSIFLERAEDTEYRGMTEGEGEIQVLEADTSKIEGYREFLLTAQSVEDRVCTVTFTKTGKTTEEALERNLYVQTVPREIEVDTSFSEEIYLEYSKIYDRDLTVRNEEAKGDKISLKNMPLLQGGDRGILQGDQVYVDCSFIHEEFQGEIAENLVNATDDKGTECSISFQEGYLALQGAQADNYMLAEKEITVPASVIIRKRPLEIKVSQGVREFGHGLNNSVDNQPSYIFSEGPWITVAQEDTASVSGLLEADQIPMPAYTEFMREELPEGEFTKPGTYMSALTVDLEKLMLEYESLQNYEISTVPGNLEIKPEKISDAGQYLELEPQQYEEDKDMYISETEQGKALWLKGEEGQLKLYPKAGTLYNEVVLLEINGREINEGEGRSLSTEGYTFAQNPETKLQEAELTLKLRRNPGEGEMTENTVDSQAFTYKVKLDSQIPEVTVGDFWGRAESLDKLQSALTFGMFGKETYYGKVNVRDQESGLKEWQYAVLPLDKDAENGEALKTYLENYIEEKRETGELVWSQPIEGETWEVPIVREEPGKEDFVANNYVIFVRACDCVGNRAIYTSRGIILDDKEPLVEISLAQGEEKEIYKDSVELKIAVRDTASQEGDSISGIQRVSCRIAIGEENLDRAEEISLFERASEKTYTLEELKKEFMTLSVTIDKEKFNSNDIWVQVTARDNSGNEYLAVKRLKIDRTRPIVQVKYETEASEEYAPYYNKDRTAFITIQERNADVRNNGGVYFDLKREGDKEPVRYSLSELMTLEGITAEIIKDTQEGYAPWQFTDDRIIEIRVDFRGEDTYTFDVHCEDEAGWINQGENQSFFIIDKTAPVLEVAYSTEEGPIEVPTKDKEGVYQNKAITASVMIKERNFACEGEDISIETEVTVNGPGIEGVLQDYNRRAKVNDGTIWTEKNLNEYTSTFTFSADGSYTCRIFYTDLAGNRAAYGPGYFTLDQKNPSGSISVKGLGFWEWLLNKITFGLFSSASIEVEVRGTDELSPIKSVQYIRTAKAMNREALEAYDWSLAEHTSGESPGFGRFSVEEDEQFIVYTKVTDLAGNYDYFSSDGIILDKTEPAPAVTITNLSASENGIFNEDVLLQIEAEDPYGGNTFSGLERVWYEVSARGNVQAEESIELLNNRNNRVQGNRTFSQVVVIPAQVYNSNEVQVQAFAIDFSGNQGESEVTEMKIDVTAPTITVSWNDSQPMNGNYYKDTRIATVKVTERNFDSDKVCFHITNTEGTPAAIGSWSSSAQAGTEDNAVSTCQVSFSADGDYTFSLDCTDLAGNTIEYGQTEAFTIDRTPPEIALTYDNNNSQKGHFYKEPRTALLTIREHNFSEKDVKARITASLEGREIPAPVISGFSGKGDVHTALITYETDGDYTFDVEYTDLAGNAAEDFMPETFTVDLTAPEIQILDIEENSANNGLVAPRVKITDSNYEPESVTVTISGANRGKTDIPKERSSIEKGEQIKFQDFPREENVDDLYTLTAKAADLAGNEKEEKILFSVNRYGSVYVLDEETKKWLSTGDYIYVNQEKPVGVIEYNIDEVQNSRILVSRDGELVHLNEGENYQVTKTSTNGQWKASYYILYEENFEKEGNYGVVFSTQDAAGNLMSNTSMKKKEESLPIAFGVDKTPPTAVISGIENGGSYGGSEKIMTVDAKDNLALNEVTVSVNGRKQKYDREELKKSDGIIQVVIKGEDSYQKIAVTASDAAGNLLGQKQKDGKAQPITLKVLVTPDRIVRFYMNKPLFFGSAAVVLLMGTGILFLAAGRKRKSRK